ncbi:putative lysophosphatidic acid phosphatase type 6 [Apostichopus japonicus]|uniref:Putative lysophosphatidic acid phosphatase type 6 n=1 Tax=Stichopus japonicus TaxID=307972 RepID=A0A2G8K277_STIJA|nr:putative lysophosphatidic acid phosphatase type 6 [Apostichopus japonicus]
MAGVYGKQLKSNSVEPLKVHVDHANREVLYPQEHLHPSLKQMWHQAQHAPDFIPGSAALIKKVKELLALPDDDKRIDLTGVKDDLSTRMVHGFPIPPQFGNDVIESLKEMSPKVLQYALGGPPGEQVKYLPISIGTLLHLIREVFQKLKEGKLKEKMHLYFCHDTTLTALLVALGIFDGDWPPLCCSISLESISGGR